VKCVILQKRLFKSVVFVQQLSLVKPIHFILGLLCYLLLFSFLFVTLWCIKMNIDCWPEALPVTQPTATEHVVTAAASSTVRILMTQIHNAPISLNLRLFAYIRVWSVTSMKWLHTWWDLDRTVCPSRSTMTSWCRDVCRRGSAAASDYRRILHCLAPSCAPVAPLLAHTRTHGHCY